ncbi:MAG: ABC transporter permease [Frankiaceae bacterium]
MYPGLTLPLVMVVAAAALVLGALAVRQPVLRWLAFRQIARRRTEAALVVSGSVLGTAIIVGALVVGDTLGFSVRQDAYRTLGPVDERVVSTAPVTGADVAHRLDAALARSPDVDGVLSGRVDQAAAMRDERGRRLAEPRVLAWDLDLLAAARFGAAGGPSGLSGPSPQPGHMVVNQPFADALHAQAGDTVTLFLAGRPSRFRVDRIVPERGLAGTGFGATRNRDAFLPPGTLDHLRSGAQPPRSVTLVSNRGGVQGGDALTATVTRQIKQALGPVSAVAVETPKRDVLRAARTTGDTLGALFLMIGSFSIIAGALLLVNIFVMLAEERKGQLGMLRATGLKRSRLVGAFALEGAAYAAAATVIGVGLGVAVGWGVAFLAAQIFGSWSYDGNGLDVTFAVTPTSLVNGAALGLVIALATIVVTSVRISRFNIIAAIRDLQVEPAAKAKRRLLVVATALAALLAVASVPVVAASQPVGTFLLPALAALCATPLLGRLLGSRLGNSIAAGAVLGWTLLANLVRPKLYDTPSMAVYVVLGSLLAFSAVVLVSENQSALLRPVRRLIERPSESALAARLAVAYPLAKRFRTGATLIMYTLIVLVLLLLSEIGGVINKSIDSQVAAATAGYSIRVDFNPAVPPARLLDRGRDYFPASSITEVAPVVSAQARSTDPGHRSTEPVSTVVAGVPAGAVSAMQFQKRLPGLVTDADVWQAVAAHSKYVVLDPFFGATGGPAGDYYRPGDTFVITDPRTGASSRKTIAGVLRNAMVFYSPLAPSAFPVVMSDTAVRAQFGTGATVSAALIRTAPGASADELAAALQGSNLSSSLVATPLASTVRRLFDANLGFFRLMQGFLAIGLLVGITGLGVVMVRAVRERRRTIGILRALGFRSRTIERAFLMESGFVALEGILLGSALGILTTWLMYQKSAAFEGTRSGYPIMWGTVAVMGAIALVASILATVGPARRAARIRPALATRIAD